MTRNLLASAALLALLPAHAAVSVTSASFTYAQNFNSLTTQTSPAQSWVNDSTLAGWSLFVSSGAAAPTYAADSGSSNTGTFRSYGDAGNPERALGGVASGSSYFGSPASGAIAGWIAVAFNNASGGAFDSFSIGFNGEQWRNGGNTNAQPMVLEYGYGASFGAVTTWTAPGASFNWNSVVNTGTAGAVNGNSAGLVTGIGGTVATNWIAGDTLWLRWTERNDTGSDHGLAIDDLQFSVTAIPEPGTWALMFAGLAAVASIARRRA